MTTTYSASNQLPSIRRIGFCGADLSVSPELLVIISKHYNWVEWGLLFRSDKEGSPRYPTWQWVESLLESAKALGASLNLAGHLCFDRCQQVLEGEGGFVQELAGKGFQRIQINATAANGVLVDSSKLHFYASNIRSLAISLPNVEWIFQYNEETKSLWEHIHSDVPPNISLLYDSSCGKGVEIQSFPSPRIHPSVRCGYAGGIGPKTIDRVITAVLEVAASAHEPVWIDMESSLRGLLRTSANDEFHDIFSIEACMQCISTAVRHGLPATP